MRQLEVPYNFDKNLISALYTIDKYGEHIHCIYMPPFREDYKSAKFFSKDIMRSQNGFTRTSYESHVDYIKQYYPDKLMLLLQQNNGNISYDLLQYYIKLGFKKFCCGSIEQAYQIKKIDKSLEVVGSITMKIEPADLKCTSERYSNFDSFVLWFPYNRDIDKIKELPSKWDYILLANCGCNKLCSGTQHWFADEDFEYSIECPNFKPELGVHKNSIRIHPMDIPIFDKYIKYYKLQGREYQTKDILMDFCLYSFEGYQDYFLCDLNYDWYKKG